MRVQSRQPTTAGDYDSARLVVAAKPAAIRACSLVQGAGYPQWRTSQKDSYRGAGAQAAGRTLEICDHWRRYRRGHCEKRAIKDPEEQNIRKGTRNLPRPNPSRRIRVDEPKRRMA